MTLTDQLVKLAECYSEGTGTSFSTISNRLFNGGSRLAAIAAGGDLNTRSFERALVWFSENWPESVLWPVGVSRPEPVEAQS